MCGAATFALTGCNQEVTYTAASEFYWSSDAWTGALVAALMDIRIKHAFPVIGAGVIMAGIIVALLSYGAVGLFG